MRNCFLIITLFFISKSVNAQVNYTGFIDKLPIELVTDISSDGQAQAVYVYTKYDAPITITGKKIKNNLTLYEKDKGKNTATLSFENFNAAGNTLTGVWKNLVTKKELPITLTKKPVIDKADGSQETTVIQSVSLADHYFLLTLNKTSGADFDRVTSVKIIQKKTDNLLQEIKLDCQYTGLYDIAVDDYNFDGTPDFSIYEEGYAGPNTSSLYYVFDPKTKRFIDSGFTGVSLDFDSKSKRITEVNQCCAGSKVTRTVYKVVNNKMVVAEEHCFVWSEKKNELVERKLKDCQ